RPPWFGSSPSCAPPACRLVRPAGVAYSPTAARYALGSRPGHRQGRNMAEPIPAQKAPYNVTVEEGKRYFWCACGRSANQPYCDGSHKDTGITPMLFNAEKTEELWFCGCKATGG